MEIILNVQRKYGSQVGSMGLMVGLESLLDMMLHPCRDSQTPCLNLICAILLQYIYSLENP